MTPAHASHQEQSPSLEFRSRESLPLDPVARMDLLLESLSTSKVGADFSSPPVGRSPKCSTLNKERTAPVTNFSYSTDDSCDKSKSHIVEFTMADESGVDRSYSVDEKFISTRDSHRRMEAELEILDFSSSALESDGSLSCLHRDPKTDSCYEAPDECLTSEPQNIHSCSLDETAATNEDSQSLDCVPSFSFDDSVSLENVADGDDHDIEDVPKSDQKLCNGVHLDHPGSKSSLDSASERPKSRDIVERSVGESPPVPVLSPSRMIDAKRRFFCEAPQPLRIDPRRVY
jgi:hypothetical protein